MQFVRWLNLCLCDCISTAMIENPGVQLKVREAYLTSRMMWVNGWGEFCSHRDSRTFWVLPNFNRGFCRASLGDIPRAKLSAVSSAR